MATIAATQMIGPGQRAVTATTLTASDTFVFNRNKNATLVINNITAGAITPLIDGDGGGDYPAPGIGQIDVSGGLTLDSIGVGEYVAIPLDSISAYLQGTITVTGGDGAEAFILEY